MAAMKVVRRRNPGHRMAAADAQYWQQKSGAGPEAVAGYMQDLRNAGAGQQKAQTALAHKLTAQTARDIYSRQSADRDFGLRKRGMDDIMTRFNREMDAKDRRFFLDKKIAMANERRAQAREGRAQAGEKRAGELHGQTIRKGEQDIKYRSFRDKWDIHRRGQESKEFDAEAERKQKEFGLDVKDKIAKFNRSGIRFKNELKDRARKEELDKKNDLVKDRVRDRVLKGKIGNRESVTVDPRGGITASVGPKKVPTPVKPGKPYEPSDAEVSNVEEQIKRAGYDTSELNDDQIAGLQGAIYEAYRRNPKASPNELGKIAAEQFGLGQTGQPAQGAGTPKKTAFSKFKKAAGIIMGLKGAKTNLKVNKKYEKTYLNLLVAREKYKGGDKFIDADLEQIQRRLQSDKPLSRKEQIFINRVMSSMSQKKVK